MNRFEIMERESSMLLASAAIGTICIALFVYNNFYRNRKKQLQSMRREAATALDKKKINLEVTLDRGHFEWIEQCTKEFGLPSADKAFRILITYAQHVASETEVFEQVRCNFCKDKDKIAKTFNVEPTHDTYLNEMVVKHKLANKDKAVRIIVDYAISSDNKEAIFGIKRCSHPDICPNC